MSHKNYVCATCGQDFTRKYTANRHNLTLHQGQGKTVRTLDYVIGRIKGEYAPADPLSYRRRYSVSVSPNNFPFGTVVHDSPPPPPNHDNTAKDDEHTQANLNKFPESYRASRPNDEKQSKLDELTSLCSKLLPYPLNEMGPRRMAFNLSQYGSKGSNINECLEALRQYDGAVSLLNSTVDRKAENNGPLSKHPHLYDLPQEIKVKLELIEDTMNSLPYSNKPSIYDEIARLGNNYRATGDRSIIDQALANHKRKSQEYTSSCLTPYWK